MRSITTFLILSVISSVIICCPAGWQQSGTVTCTIDYIYGRGAGYPWQFGDPLNLSGAKQRCENANPALGCEQWGQIYYPKCKQNYRNDACCFCVAICPNGYKFLDLFQGILYCTLN